MSTQAGRFTSGNVIIEKQSIGSVGAVNNTQQAVSLTDISAADSTVAGFNLSGGVTKTFGTATATLTDNAVAAFDSEGFYGRGDVARFDGSSNAISSTDAHFLSTGKDWSFSMWVAADAWEPSGGQLLMGNGGGTNGTRGTDILLNGPGSAGIQLRVSDNGGASASDQLSVDGSSFKSGSWHHIAGTYDFSATTLKFYIDGVLVDSSSSVTDTNTESTFYLGDENASGAAFNGSIQDFIWIDGDLYSDAEVNAIYSRRFEGPQIKGGHVLTSSSFPSSIVSTDLSFYNLGDVNDDSGNARTLTNNGSTAFTGFDIFGVAGIADLDGVDDYLSSSDSFFNQGEPFVAGGWFSADWSADNFFLGNTFSNSDRGWRVDITGNVIRFNSGNSSSDYDIGQPVNISFITGSWHHLAFAYTGSEAIGYIDGVRVTSATQTAQRVTTSGDLELGTTNNGILPAAMKIQDFFYIDGVVNDDDIRKIYSAKITHNLGTAIEKQSWSATTVDETNQKAATVIDGFVAAQDTNDLYIDFGEADPGEQVEIKLK